MRRFVLLCIVGMLVIAPTACARNGSDTRNQPPVTPQTPPADNDDTYVPMNYYY